MALSPEILRTELVEVRRRLNGTKREWDEIQERLRKLQQQEQALTVLLDGREEATQTQIEDLPLRKVREDALFAEVEAGTNKTEVIRQIIRESGPNGASPTDIWQGVQKRNIPMHRNYVYAVLARLAEKNEAKEANGRYTLTQVQ
jgi:DNA repair exonuclease SbcCD ATPase subunit